jgi:hypothetical protein
MSVCMSAKLDAVMHLIESLLSNPEHKLFIESYYIDLIN